MGINDFLKKIARDIESNGREYKKEDFYYILKYVGIKRDISLALDIEAFYQEFLNHLKSSLVKFEIKKCGNEENITNYIGFYIDKKASLDAIKVYFPVKYEYMISVLKSVFLYIIRNSIKAQIKFHVKATNENIVIKFYESKDVLPFINYCSTNFILSDLLENSNPFIPNIDGLGIVKDNGIISYNETVSIILSEYFMLVKSENNLERVSDLDFLDYIIKRGNIEEDEKFKFNIKALEENIRAILNHAEKDLI